MRAKRGIYAIVDLDVCLRDALDPVETAGAFFKARLPWLQVRVKHGADRGRLQLMREVAQHRFRTATTTLVANDRPDLALIAGMDGVHVGQDDTSVEDIKSRFPSLLVGVSTHKLAEMEAALNGPSDYVAWGPIYQTASKKNPEPTVGAESLPLVGKASRDRGRPLVGIGGIDEARIGLVGPHLDYVAMISALVGGASAQRNPYEWIYERAMQLNARVSAISRS